jgi:hypothetical protein
MRLTIIESLQQFVRDWKDVLPIGISALALLISLWNTLRDHFRYRLRHPRSRCHVWIAPYANAEAFDKAYGAQTHTRCSNGPRNRRLSMLGGHHQAFGVVFTTLAAVEPSTMRREPAGVRGHDDEIDGAGSGDHGDLLRRVAGAQNPLTARELGVQKGREPLPGNSQVLFGDLLRRTHNSNPLWLVRSQMWTIVTRAEQVRSALHVGAIATHAGEKSTGKRTLAIILPRASL